MKQIVIMLVMVGMLISISGCGIPQQTKIPDVERYLKALKILFQADMGFKKNVLAEIEYRKYLQETKTEVYDISKYLPESYLTQYRKADMIK